MSRSMQKKIMFLSSVSQIFFLEIARNVEIYIAKSWEGCGCGSSKVLDFFFRQELPEMYRYTQKNQVYILHPNPSPLLPKELRYIKFFCAYLMQFLAIFFGYLTPILTPLGLETRFSVQISTFHAIHSKKSFAPTPPPYMREKDWNVHVFMHVYKAPTSFAKLLCIRDWWIPYCMNKVPRGFVNTLLYRASWNTPASVGKD